MQHYPTPDLWVIGYTAGIIDGEGSISAINSARKSRWRVQTSQADSNNGADLCHWLRDQWGIGRVYHQAGLCDVHIWNVCRINEIEHLLGTCLPYLRVKRQRAQEVLDFLGDKSEFRRGVWSAGELHYLRTNAGTKRVEDISVAINRSPNSVRAKRVELGLAAPPRNHADRDRLGIPLLTGRQSRA